MMPRRWANCRPSAHLQRDVQHDAASSGWPGPDAPRQAAPLVIGHDKIRAGGAVGHFQHRHDVGMLELLQMAGLLDEAMHDLRVRHQFRPDHLDGHAPAASVSRASSTTPMPPPPSTRMDFVTAATWPAGRDAPAAKASVAPTNSAIGPAKAETGGTKAGGLVGGVVAHGAGPAAGRRPAQSFAAAWSEQLSGFASSTQACPAAQSRPRRNSASGELGDPRSSRTSAAAMLA